MRHFDALLHSHLKEPLSLDLIRRCAGVCAAAGLMVSRMTRPYKAPMEALLRACAEACRACEVACAARLGAMP